jgi:hypothetical protein
VDTLSTGLSLTPGGTVRTRLQIGSGTTFDAVFLSRTVEVSSERGAVSGTEQLTTGVVVAANAVICPSAVEFSANLVRSARLLEIVLRGYFNQHSLKLAVVPAEAATPSEVSENSI